MYSYNRMTAWAFASRLQTRLGRTDGSVDLLITGCEVSLWLGEQFAADVHLAFPKLKVANLTLTVTLTLTLTLALTLTLTLALTLALTPALTRTLTLSSNPSPTPSSLPPARRRRSW